MRRQLPIDIAGLVACYLLLGFASIKPFSLLTFGGDALHTLTQLKNYIDGNGFRIIPNLAYPGVQDNLYFPNFDFLSRAVMRVVGLFAGQISTMSYLFYVLGIAGIFTASTVALRSLGIRHWLTTLGAVVYVVSPYFVFRSLGHDFLALYFGAPLGAALALRIGMGKLVIGAGTLVTLAVIATSGLYYAFFAVLFAMFTGFVSSTSHGSAKPILLATLCAAVVFPIMVVGGFGFGIVDAIRNPAPMIERAPYEQLVYGLFPADAVQVFAIIPPFRWMYQQYQAFRPQLNYTTGLYEWPGIFLTLVILMSPVILAVTGSIQRQRSDLETLIYLSAACLVFGIIFSINGGLGYYFNLLVSPSIRAQARVMPYLSFFALAIVLVSIELLLRRKSIRGATAAFAGVAMLLASMLPTVGAFAKRHKEVMAREGIQQNIESAKKVLAVKDAAHLTTVLQLPHISWPEVAIKNFDQYTMLSYFLFDHKGSKTRWSYGGMKEQPSFLSVKNMLDDHPETGLSEAAATMGFDAILIEKKAYEADGWAPVVKNIQSSPHQCKIFEDDRRIMFSLNAVLDCLNDK